MSILHVRQIKSTLQKLFKGTIDTADVRGPAQEQENALLTRSLAAFALVTLADVDPSIATKSVTDGYGDNGIDLVYFDETKKKLYIVQSKWSHKGNSTPEVGEVHKFISGIEDLINAEFSRFNDKIKNGQAEITAALDDSDTKIVLCIIYTGIQTLSQDANRELKDLLDKLNDTSEVVSLEVLPQAGVHQAISGQVRGSPINLDVMLQDWGQLQEPLGAFYGQIEASVVADWFTKHRNRLFIENLRNYRGSTDVNDAIQKTLESDPERFFYLNNGLTALCDRVVKKLKSDVGRESGVFECEGLSIVNGAQTVGSIAAAYAKSPEKAGKARLLLRLFSLENAPEGFGREVTIATNTQNRIERRDFVALDPEQERLRAELWIDGREYVYRSGDLPPKPDKGCTVTEATIALACASSDISLAVQAKREIGLLWEDIKKPPYRLIFNKSLSSLRLWRAVEILKTVDLSLAKEQKTRTGRPRLISVHGNRFVLHKVFQSLPADCLEDPDLDFEILKKKVAAATAGILNLTDSAVSKSFSSSYPATLFKSQSKCKTLSARVTPLAIS